MIKIRTHKSKIISIFCGIILLVIINGNNFRYGLLTNENIYNDNEIDLKKAGYPDLYKYNKIWGGNGEESFHDVDYDIEGNIYVTGYTASYGAGDDDIVLLKYDPLGNLLWNQTWGTINLDRPEAICVDNESNIYITGYTKIPDAHIYDKQEMIILKFNSTGHLKWAKQETFGSDHGERGLGIILDNQNNIIICGFQYIGSTDAREIILVKYNSTGDQQWFKTWSAGASSLVYGEDLVLDKDGNFFVTGYRYNPGDMILVKFDSSGNYQWNKLWSWTSRNVGKSISIDNESNYLYCAGYSLDGGGVFLVKYDLDGNIISEIKGFGGYDPIYDGANSLAFKLNDTIRLNIDIDDLNNIYIPTFNSTYKNGLNDLILYKFNEDLEQITNHSWGGFSDDYGFGIAINSEENELCIVGKTYSFGNGSADGVLISYSDDSIAPEITIVNPISNDLFGSSAPDYDLTVTDANLDSIWYTLDGGSTNSTPVSTNGTIDQAMWNAVGNGTVTIRFYANDTLGNINYEEIIMLKDIIEPSIAFNSPNPNDLFVSSAPDYDLTVTDANLQSIWYTLDGGATNSTPVSDSGTIDQAMWNAVGNGTVTIRFYAIDTVGNLKNEEVIVYKDIIEPSIAINIPNPNDLFGSKAPNYDLTIIEGNLDSIWYTLDGGLINSTFVSDSGIIDQAMWNTQPNGTVIIRFYANDSLGNLNYEEVIVRKDIIEPTVTINSPNTNNLFGLTAPGYNLTVTDTDLDSIWYSLDGGLTNSTSVALTGTIDLIIWNTHSNGTITIRFYANDTTGNLHYEEVIVRKDIIEPSIAINNPNSNDLFGTLAPDFEVTISDSNGISTQWYTIDGGITNYTFVGSMGPVNQAMWNAVGNGTVTIRFYANDTVGNTAFSEINVRKDIEDPIISIVTPNMNEVFEIAPAYEITITEANLDKIWYSFDGGSNIMFITGLIGVIDLTLWNQLPNGYITIRFYANDTLGNISFDEVIVVKDTPTPNPPPGGIPGYNTLLLIGIVSTISVIIIKKRINHLN